MMSRLRWFLIAIVWIGACVGGTIGLIAYESRAGRAASGATAIDISGADLSQTSLVVCLHPRCPCSTATLGELRKLLQSPATKSLQVTLLFVRPEGVAADWEKSHLWETAGELPGARRVVDIDGREARRLGAATSGQTFLFDAEQRLLFSGGITIARGHAGENPGVDSVLEILGAGKRTLASTPVFGCPLFQTDMPDDLTRAATSTDVAPFCLGGETCKRS